MWARIIEFMLAGWLALSPFILHYSSQEMFFWYNDFISAFFIVLFALLSFWDPLRKIHLLSLGIAFWLIFLGYVNFPLPAAPSHENSLLVGMLILMLAIVPSHSELSSRSWEEFYRKKSNLL